jgi:transposase InsO family protein
VDKWWFGFWHGLYNLGETVLWLQVCLAFVDWSNLSWVGSLQIAAVYVLHEM